MSGPIRFKEGDKFLMNIEDGGRIRTEWFVVESISLNPDHWWYNVLQSGSLRNRMIVQDVDDNALSLEDALSCIEEAVSREQYTPQYEKPALRPLSSLKEGDKVELDPDACPFAYELVDQYGTRTLRIKSIDTDNDGDMSLNVGGTSSGGMWVDNTSVKGVDFSA